MNKQSWLILGLLVSMSVNLLIAGIVIGRAGQRPPGPPPASWMEGQLDQESRQLVRRTMAGKQREVAPLREALRKAMSDVRRAVTAEEYDAQALADALERVRAARGSYEAFIHNNLAEVSANLNRQQRAALVRAALQRGQDGSRNVKRKMPSRPGG